METCFLKHGYPPGYHYKSSKSSLNNTTGSDSPQSSNDAQDHSQPSLTAIQDQFLYWNSPKRTIGTADRHGDLYVIQAQATFSEPLEHFSCNTAFTFTDTTTLWHHRLGHTSDSVHKCITSQFPSIAYKLNKQFPCDTCQFSKQRRLPYAISTSQSYKIFDILHADIWGPYSIASISGHKYFLTLVDDFSRFTWVILMKHKSETRGHIVNFLSYIET